MTMQKGITRTLIKRGADLYKDRLSIIAPEGNFTYSQLAEKVKLLGLNLKKAGVGSGVQVALALPNSLSYLEWYFGVLDVGGIVVPLAPALTETEKREIILSSTVSIWLNRDSKHYH